MDGWNDGVYSITSVVVVVVVVAVAVVFRQNNPVPDAEFDVTPGRGATRSRDSILHARSRGQAVRDANPI
jgi:hypothetical protein